MRRIHAATLLCTVLAAFVPAHGQTTAPSTRPGEVLLDHGKCVFVAPPELTLLGKSNEDRSAAYVLGDNRALVTILVTPQDHAVTRAVAPQIAARVRKQLREEASRGEMDVILAPREYDDARFLVAVRDRFNTLERFGDRVHLYRPVGLYLGHVVVTVFTEDEAEAKRVHEIGAEMLMSLRLNREGTRGAKGADKPPAAPRPVTFAAARVRVTPPAGWRAEANDVATGGVIVTYRDAADETNLITVSVRPLPPEARRDRKLRDLAVDEMVEGEKQSFRIDGAEVVGETQTVTDRRFLRKTRTDYEHEGRRFRVTSRQVRAGDVIASVTIVAREESAESVDAIADRVALSVKPVASDR